jgi:uncharacterized PurR-regulated membrane protein YhhQ (DUF165 family)
MEARHFIVVAFLVALVIAAISGAILFNSINKRDVEQQKFNVCTESGGTYVRQTDERSVCVR